MTVDKRIRSILMCIICAFWVCTGFAAAADDEDLDVFNMSLEQLANASVTGVSKYRQGMEKAPASALVITRAQMDERGYADLSDLLKDVPGLDITGDAGRFGEYYVIRGIEGNDRFLVMVDGHKINPAGGTYLSVGNSIALHFAKQVEIIFGPASAVYGADAFSGIINIVSRKPAANAEMTFRGDYGSNRRTSLSLFGAGKTAKGFSYTAMGRLFRSDGPELTGRGYDEYDSIVQQYTAPQRPRFEQPLRDHTVFARLSYKQFSVSYFRQHFNQGNSLAMPPSLYVFNKEAKWEMTTDMVWAGYEKTFVGGGVFNLDVSYVSHVQDPDTQFFKWTVQDLPDTTFSQYMTGEDRTLKGVLSYNQKLSRQFQFIAGLEYEHTRSIPPYANDEVLGNSYKYEGDNAATIDENLTVRENRFGSFLQVTYSPSETVDVVVGGRYDHSSRYGGTFNRRMGVIFNPAQGTTVKLIHGSAFQAPSLFYQFEQFGGPAVVFRSTNEIKAFEDPGWKLDNQRLRTYEAYVRQMVGKNLKLSLSLYHNRLFDLIERVLYDPTGSTWNKYFNTYTNGLRNENIGREKITGLNFTLDMAFNKYSSAYLFYSLTDARVDRDGETSPIARVARHKLWVGAEFRDLLGYITLSSRFKWVGDMNTAPSNRLYHGEKQPGYVNLDLTVSVKNLLGNTRFFLYLGNVFNGKIEHAGLFGQSGVFAPILPQEGFHFRLGVRLTLKRSR